MKDIIIKHYGVISFRLRFNQTFDNIPEDILSTFKKKIIPRMVNFVNEHKYHVRIVVTSIRLWGDYPSIDYHYEPLSKHLSSLYNKTTDPLDRVKWWWPNGCAGTVWLEEEPAEDAI